MPYGEPWGNGALKGLILGGTHDRCAFSVEIILNLLTFLTTAENLNYYPHSMYTSRFNFAFIYRYQFTGSGDADGVLTFE
jgi:hypothetical protein